MKHARPNFIELAAPTLSNELGTTASPIVGSSSPHCVDRAVVEPTGVVRGLSEEVGTANAYPGDDYATGQGWANGGADTPVATTHRHAGR